MSNVITFPGVIHAAPTRPTRIADLPEGAKAIVIVPDRGGFALEMRPAATERERQVRTWFPEHCQALRQARAITTTYFALYRLILDETETGGAA